ncbi:O-antigen ligase family protein [Candidatus Parcubacteria bacterium]|nr:O-antigen ligase family protein [Candidatus Parcubacteria bacterium]
MTIVFAVLTVLFALIAWMRLPAAVLLMVALLPSYLLRASVFGVPTTLLEMMLLLVGAVWLIQNRKRLRELFSLQRRWAVAIALLVLAATISAIVADNTFAALGIWKAYFMEPILFFYLLVDLLRRSQISYDRLRMVLLAGGAVVAVVAVAQWLTGQGIPIPWDLERRVTGVFDYPNALGLYLGPLAVLAISSLFLLSKPSPAPGQEEREDLTWRDPSTRWRSLGLIGSFLLFTGALILAESEAALAALVVTLVVLGLIRRSMRAWTIALVVLLAMGGFSIPFTRTYLIQKITLQDVSGQVRLSQWSETWELLKDRPVFGAGLSGYPTALVPYHRDTHIEIYQYPHTILFNIWTELGLLGLVAFFLLLKESVSAIIRSPRTGVWMWLPLFHMSLHGLFDVPYFKNDLALLTWIFLALFYASLPRGRHTTDE